MCFQSAVFISFSWAMRAARSFGGPCHHLAFRIAPRSRDANRAGFVLHSRKLSSADFRGGRCGLSARTFGAVSSGETQKLALASPVERQVFRHSQQALRAQFDRLPTCEDVVLGASLDTRNSLGNSAPMTLAARRGRKSRCDSVGSGRGRGTAQQVPPECSRYRAGRRPDVE